jgi:type 1 glutamine amidotransferase/sugar phosphate isomerase/epimerase
MKNTRTQLCRRLFLRRMAATSLLAPAWPALLPAQTPNAAAAGDLQKIEAALPAKAPATPRKPRKLLIFTLNVAYGGHPSIATANEAFTRMGRKTSSFETVISKDPQVFQRESLSRFDAVFLNNTVGNLFEDPGLRENLAEFVHGGGGLMGVHGTSVGFVRWPSAAEDWPEFGFMLGARGANHRDSREHVFIRVEDPSHPVVRSFGGDFDYRDEFFRFGDPYSRRRVRVLLSIDNAKTDANQGAARGAVFRQDNDYALAWVRQYGRGRVFYCTIAHNPDVFWDPRMLEFYLAATQFALGDLPAPTIPSGRLTPALTAQERLGWRLGLASNSLPKQTLFEVIDKAAELGLLFIDANDQQTVSREISQAFNHQLSVDQLRAIRLKLEAAGVRLLAYHLRSTPTEADGWRQLFDFGRKMGVDSFAGAPPPAALDGLGRLCDEYDIRFALEPRDEPDSSPYTQPADVLKMCRDRTARIGACGDLDAWMRAGIAPLEAIQMLKGRLVTLQISDFDKPGGGGHDVPWGTGVANLPGCLAEIRRQAMPPLMLGIDSAPGVEQSIGFFNKVSLETT